MRMPGLPEIPSSEFIDIAQNVGAEFFLVPKMGLIDGIIHLLYEKWTKTNPLK
jgi:hypothetical protein